MLSFKKYLLVEENAISHHVTFMRGNPIHIGHESVVNQVTNAANKEQAGHTIYMTRSQDKNKNPLTPEQKIKHARAAFPNSNVELTSPDAPTLLHQASKLYSKGVNKLHVHIGSDRVDDFHKILHTYNGKEGKHGYYNFHSIDVHPVGGDRSNAANDLDGASATKMRAAVSSGNREAFHKMAPTTMNKTQKNSMYADVHSGLFPPKEETEVKPKKKK